MEAMTRVEMPEHMDLVNRVVAGVKAQYGHWVETDDLRQEAAIWWYSDNAQRHIPKYLEDEPHFTRLRRSIFRFLCTYAEAEKAARSGYNPRDQYRYSPREIVDLIPIALDPEGLPLVGHHEEGPSAKGNLAEGGDVLAGLIDVRRALEALPEDDLHFLTLADDCGYDWDRVARRHDTETLPDSLRRRFARIGERMARWLHKEEDYQ